jgi:signal transduction histidine kinase
MKFLDAIRRRLAVKLFLSYLVIILVGVVVLAVTADLHAPAALDRHVAHMQAMMGQEMGMMADLQRSFSSAVAEVLLVAAAAAFVAAVIVSSFTARRIVQPIQAMTRASRRIAAGDYRDRVETPGQDELADLAGSFNRMAAALEQTEQRRLELIGNVAHELRTPLSSIRSLMEGLIDGVLPAEAETFLDVQREVSRLQRLVQDLEELSRAEAGQIALEMQPVSLPDLLATAATRLQSQFDDKEVSLTLDIAPDLPDIQADPTRLVQVLLNLLGNALQYTPAGGRVTVHAWRQGQELLVSVKDSGVGLAAEHLPHIFERFYRVDKSRSRAGGGSGIGLTIAKRLVAMHGGRIWASSDGVGRGSTFTFSLPIGQPADFRVWL